MKDYTCAICGKQYSDLDFYLTCVHNCGEKLRANKRAEEEKKKLEEVNSYLTRIKETKKNYEKLLEEFRIKYPEEYKINFKSKCLSCNDWLSPIDKEEDNDPEVFTFSYEDNGKDKPVIKANGKDVTEETLFSDPDVKYLAKLLGILD